MYTRVNGWCPYIFPPQRIGLSSCGRPGMLSVAIFARQHKYMQVYIIIRSITGQSSLYLFVPISFSSSPAPRFPGPRQVSFVRIYITRKATPTHLNLLPPFSLRLPVSKGLLLASSALLPLQGVPPSTVRTVYQQPARQGPMRATFPPLLFTDRSCLLT